VRFLCLLGSGPGTGDQNRIIRMPYVDWRAGVGGRPFSSWSVGGSILLILSVKEHLGVCQARLLAGWVMRASMAIKGRLTAVAGGRHNGHTVKKDK
jgi:hypothetical protein